MLRIEEEEERRRILERRGPIPVYDDPGWIVEEVNFEVADDLAERQRILLWGIESAEEFGELARNIRRRRRFLKRLNPQEHQFPKTEFGWCIFTLGSEWASCIYGTKHIGRPRYGRQPKINIVIHLKQKEIMYLIKCMWKWFQVIGMDNDLSRWLFALFSCLSKPFDEKAFELLDRFYSDIEAEIADDNEEAVRLYLIRSIMIYYLLL